MPDDLTDEDRAAGERWRESRGKRAYYDPDSHDWTWFSDEHHDSDFTAAELPVPIARTVDYPHNADGVSWHHSESAANDALALALDECREACAEGKPDV